MSSYLDVSAPVVFNYTITHRNVTLWIRGPETPFEKNGKKLIMIESGLGHDLDLRDLEFNSSLFEIDNPNDLVSETFLTSMYVFILYLYEW